MSTPVKRIIYNPLLTSEEEVRLHIQSESPGTAHPFERILFVWDGKEVQKLDYRDRPDDFFLDNTSLNQLGDVLAQRMAAHEAALTDVLGYDVITPTELAFDIPLESGKIFCLALSNHTQPTYYDLFIGSAKADVLCYGATTNRMIP